KRVLAAMASVSREEDGVERPIGGGAGVPIERKHYENLRRTDAGATCCRQAAHVRGCPFVARGPEEAVLCASESRRHHNGAIFGPVGLPSDPRLISPAHSTMIAGGTPAGAALAAHDH